MSGSDSNSHIDAQLRDVPLPDGLLARLRQTCTITDEEIDGLLVDVPLPVGLLDRCQLVARDEQMDEQLRDVPEPWDMVPRLRVIPQVRTRSRLTRWAVAASLMFVVSSLFFSSLGGLLVALQPRQQQPVEVFVYEGPLELASSPVEVVFSEVPSYSPPHEPANETVVWTSTPLEMLDLVDGDSVGMAEQLMEAMEAGFDPWQDVMRLKWGALGAPHFEEAVKLEEVEMPSAMGIQQPLVPGYDRAFLLSNRIHPPAFPAANVKLTESRLPLVTSTSSVDLTRQRLRHDRLPDADQIRVEEFLAAMNYEFAAPDRAALALHMAAGPAELGSPGAGLLQVGIKAQPNPQRELAATHITVALDASTSMGWTGRFEMARRAIAELFEFFGPRDRFSMVVFNDDVLLQVEPCGRESADEVLRLLRLLEPGGGTNISGGLQQAVSLSMNESLDHRLAKRLILITDGRARMPDATAGRMHDLMSEAVARGVDFRVFSIGEAEDADSQLSRLATNVGGSLISLNSARQLGWGLTETLFGSTAVVASDSVLTVTFNPNVVAAYRLIGHEANALASLNPVTVQSEMRAGEEATALYEIWLRRGSEEVVATAEIRWKDPRSGEAHVVKQQIRRFDIAGTFAETPLSLQAAMVAAETAEILRGSYNFQIYSLLDVRPVPKPRDLRGVMELTRRVNERLAKQPDFKEFVSLLHQIIASRQLRRGS